MWMWCDAEEAWRRRMPVLPSFQRLYIHPIRSRRSRRLVFCCCSSTQHSSWSLELSIGRDQSDHTGRTKKMAQAGTLEVLLVGAKGLENTDYLCTLLFPLSSNSAMISLPLPGRPPRW
jgi:hypothetical protein